jgi:hypothetical protein
MMQKFNNLNKIEVSYREPRNGIQTGYGDPKSKEKKISNISSKLRNLESNLIKNKIIQSNLNKSELYKLYLIDNQIKNVINIKDKDIYSITNMVLFLSKKQLVQLKVLDYDNKYDNNHNHLNKVYVLTNKTLINIVPTSYLINNIWLNHHNYINLNKYLLLCSNNYNQNSIYSISSLELLGSIVTLFLLKSLVINKYKI